MEERKLLRKDQLEVSLRDEKRLIEEGVLKEDNPLDLSDNFRNLCEAARRGDMKICQEMIQEGVNINAKDQYDYTPLILASLCGHFETVELLLESGALCERDTFQGERCLYNALNDKIRNLLLSYDYSKSTNPLQPLASHLVSLLSKIEPATSDISVTQADNIFHLHKFVLAARSPYFATKLAAAPETSVWNLISSVPPQSFDITIRHLYLGELPLPGDLGGGPGTGFTDSEILTGIDKISKKLEIQNLSKPILDGEDRRIARQRQQDELEAGRDQIQLWFRTNVLGFPVRTKASQAPDVKWDRNNSVFADVLLRADDDDDDNYDDARILAGTLSPRRAESRPRSTNVLGIPVMGSSQSRSPSRNRDLRDPKSVLYPCHKAMLIRSEYFMTMFDSTFKEAQDTPYLQVITVDCSPTVLEIVLTFLYTEKADFGLDVAIDVLFAADMLFLEKLKTKAAVVISSLGNGIAGVMPTEIARADEDLDIYEILRAAWTTRVQRLEEFAARYIAYRLEAYVDDPEFAELVKESANRIRARQETDTIEILDDIRYYLSERFRLRFEDVGFDEAMDEEQHLIEEHAAKVSQDQAALVTDADAQVIQKDQRPKKACSKKNGSLKDKPIDARTPIPYKGDETRESRNHEEPVHLGGGGGGIVRTLDGELAGDEFAADAINYQILLGKIDTLLENLKLDA